MNLQFNWARFESLSTQALYDILAAREAVFVVEQQCAYQEADGVDVQSWHLQVTVEGALAAYARAVPPGVKYSQPSIGRVMTVQSFRGLSIGRALMDEAIRFTEQAYPGMGIKIGGQLYLKDFYESLGFETISEPYDEDGILHIEMLRPSTSVG